MHVFQIVFIHYGRIIIFIQNKHIMKVYYVVADYSYEYLPRSSDSLLIIRIAGNINFSCFSLRFIVKYRKNSTFTENAKFYL